MKVKEIKTYKKVNYTDDLQDIINNLNVSEVNDLIANFGYQLKNANKNDRALELISLYKDKRELKKLIELLTIDEFKFLKKLLNNNGIIDVMDIEDKFYLKLYKLKIIDLFGNYDNDKTCDEIAIVPEDIKVTLSELNIDNYKSQVEHNTNYLNTVKAVINYYGIFKKDDLVKIVLANYKNIDVNKTMINVSRIVTLMDYNIILINIKNVVFYGQEGLTKKSNYVINNLFENYKNIKQIKFSDIIQYKDNSYYGQNEEIDKLKTYLIEKEYNNEQVKEILKDFLFELRSSIPNMSVIYTKILGFRPYINYINFNELSMLIGNIIEKEKNWLNLTGKEMLSVKICSCCGDLEGKVE